MSSTSSVNVSRSAFRASRSGISSSWKGTCPRCSAWIFSGTTSRITTSWPSSAKHEPVTSPTQPAPKIPIFDVVAIGAETYFPVVRGLRPFAIASIVSFERSSSKVLTTQYEALPRCSTTMCRCEPE